MHSVLMDDACILKTHVFMQRWCDIAIVVFIIKSPHLAYSVDNRQHSTSATLNIGLNIGFSEHRNNRPSEQSAKCNIGQALIVHCWPLNLELPPFLQNFVIFLEPLSPAFFLKAALFSRAGVDSASNLFLEEVLYKCSI